MKYTDIQNLVEAHYKSEDDFHNAVDRIIKAEEIAGKDNAANRIRATFNQYGCKKRDGYTVMPLHDLAVLNKSKNNMCDIRHSHITLQDVIAPPEAIHSITDAINEFKNKEALVKYGLEVTNKILLHGPPGVGKTWTAMAIAGELKMDLVFVRWDSLVSSYLGSTGNNIRKVFEVAATQPVVLFLDEFDAVGKDRGGGTGSEVGEMSRVVINVLQNIDMFPPESFLIAATNHGQLLDTAVWRRFSVVDMDIPGEPERRSLIAYYAKGLPITINNEEWVRKTDGMSGADIKTMIHKEAKKHILNSGRLKLQMA